MNPTSITATDITVDKDNTITANNYTPTATGLSADQYVYNYVTATSGNTSVATVTNTNGTFTITGVEEGTSVITITAYNTDNATTACTTTFTVTVQDIQTGVSGGTVTLDDREDHNWTYYSGVDASVDGGNYNSNYDGKLYSPNPRNVKITYKANGGAVSIDESETEFVYYKTLEEGTTSGQYPYTVISNPFSKRPNGKGFGGWRIKEGAEYINGYNDEAVLPLDADIVFTNLPYPSVNCTSAEIELEATWVNLNDITYANNNTITYNVSGGTYETNILVLNRNVTGTITTSSPVTIMMVEPDGSSDYRGTYTFTGNITPNNTGVTKIEFTRWNSTNTLNCNNHSVTVGRGMTTTSQCASYVTGVTGVTTNRGLTTYTANLNYHLKIESGTFTDVSFIAGTDGTYGYVNCNGTSNRIKGTLGNDYDRAKGDNTKLNVADELFLGYLSTYANGNQTNADFKCWVKSGNLCSGTNVTNTTFNGSGSPNGGYYGDASQVFYCSVGGAQTNIGKRTVYVEGGILSGIAGGIDSNNPANNESFFVRMTGGQVRGVVYGSGAFAASSGIRRFVITGGTINGWIAAGCNGTDPTQSGGTLPSDTYVYVGGDARVGNASNLTLNTSSDGNIFGAGSGNAAQATTGQVNNSNVVIADQCYIKNNVYGGGNYGYSNAKATVYVTGGEVSGSVFGGSNQKQGVNVEVNMTGGQVNGGVYGGSNVTGTISGSVTMNINGGQVGTSSATANIHGGGYGQATRVSGNVDLTLGESGQTEAGVTVYGDVYGGSALGYVNGTAATTTYHTNVTLNKGTINGSLYGGALGDASNAANVYGPVAVEVNGGSVTGSVFGCNNAAGSPKGNVTVTINGSDPTRQVTELDEHGNDVFTYVYALNGVYGGGNLAAYEPASSGSVTTVTVNGCETSIKDVYGGGNAAPVPSTEVVINGGEIDRVFAGGNGESGTPAHVGYNTTNTTPSNDYGTGTASVTITNGSIQQVFGGSNSNGSIRGTSTINVNKGADTCELRISQLYGGGNFAAGKPATINVGCTGDNDEGEGITQLYGGANQADVDGDILLNITGGNINNVFGGNNKDGNITGTITINVEITNTSCDNHIDNVFGGGNQAAYTGDPKINIKHGTIYGSVFGGGFGDEENHEKGCIFGNPQITIGDDNTGNVTGTPVIHVLAKDNTTIDGGVYGGGNSSSVGGTDVNIDGGTIGEVFGGGHGAAADPDIGFEGVAADVNGNASVKIIGGTIDKVFAGSNLNGNISGTTAVNINKGGTCAMIIGEVYGGGNEADGKAGTITIGCTGTLTTQTTEPDSIGVNLEGIGAIYGGANAANVGKAGATSDININITSGIVGKVYGGNNSSGTIFGDITVNINKDSTATCADNWYMGSVFGGGFGKDTKTEGNVDVIIDGASVIHGDVYGGSALGQVNSGTEDYTHVTLNAGTIYGDAYGGGLGQQAKDAVGTEGEDDYVEAQEAIAALVNGNVKVTQNGVAFVKATTNDDAGNTVVTAGRIFGCNNLNGSPQGTVLVLVNKTSDAPTLGTYDMNAVYGGGNLAAYEPADATLNATGQFTEYTDKEGNTVTRALSKSPLQVVINGCDYVSIEYVYGGGNAAPTPSTDVLVLGAKEIGYVFGGGNGKDRYTLDGGTTWNTNPGADVGVKKNGSDYGTGNANSSLYGGLIHEAYGASNQKGTIKGSITLDVQEGEVDCPLTVEKIVGAGKNADVDGDIIMVMGCMPADRKTDEVFGGADNANVNGNVELTITSGTFGKVFGGNNLGGIIKGHIKVNIEETGCSPIRIDELYLGGNQAAYSIFGYYEDNGNLRPRESDSDTHTAVTGNHTAPYAQPELNVISCSYIGKVFGGGLGTGAVMYADPTVNINMIPGLYANDATKGVPAVMTTEHINSADNPDNLGVVVDVYGGGNEAAVHGNTTVNVGTTIGQSVTLTSTHATANVVGAFVSGTVYGAGKGVATNPEAAIVKGNTRVNMAGGYVSRSIYGGGELSSVGTFTETYSSAVSHPYHAVGEPKTCADNTGLTEVIISGGQVGLVNQKMPNPNDPTSDDDYGYVFCAGKGVADSVTYVNAHKLAVCGSTHLQITGGLIAASAYGGSENGQVLGDTRVQISGGQIGSGYYKDGSGDHWDPAYTDTQWNTAIDKIKDGTFTDADAAPFHECDAWEFGTEGNRHVYDHYANESGYDAKGGATPGTDGHSFFGHVFGGGSGFYPFAAGKWRRTAGRVNGNTLVEITGGHVLTNVYGGNEITDVLGHSKVEMTGGTVGVPRSVGGIQARPVNSYIFGAGMGDPRVLFNGWSNVGSSEVIVHGDAVVFGSVFGGGEDGHVLGNSSTTIKGNALIGTFGTSGVDGNIFGSGRGFSALALTAGVICGNITVNISENAKILGSVFGGGRLAAVGTYLAEEGTANYGKLQPGDDHGNVTINITGGTIGTKAGITNHDYSLGDVFGGSKGALMSEWAKSQKLGLVKNTTVNISQATGSTTTIYGNVYGGGELASVGSYNYATTQAEVDAYNANHSSEPAVIGDVLSVDEADTGLATIVITGGTIGQNSLSDTHGLVFGGCLGKAGTGYSGYSFVNNSDVTLNGGTVYGCVFGGGENGHVLHDTDVKIQSGTVGIQLDNAATLVDNMIYRGNVYGGGRGIDTYVTGSGHHDYSITAGKVSGNTNVTVSGGTIYRCVYGGGSLASVGDRDETADASLVTTTHPFPYATGLATVTISGGQIGTDGGAAANNYTTYIPVREARRENGYVYGSGRGMSAGTGSGTNETLLHLAYTTNTIVSIEGTANVTGSVFGGGENGHVKNDTKVYVKENCFVGTELKADEHAIDDNGRGRLIYRGNVYGGGRGIDQNNSAYSVTAGRVYGNTFVEVSGGKIYHDVFGGGSLASVGYETINTTTGEVTYDDESGQTKVVIKGGIVGYSATAKYQGFNCGFVYGGCRGLAAAPSSALVKMAYVHRTEVDIETGADIKGSVFGGGANGHVKNDTYVKITGGSIGTPLFDDDPNTTDVDESEACFDDYGVAVKPIFRGNVYAGGRGVDQYNLSASPTYSMTAGAVYGNAKLEMFGGHVWHNVYGSGAMASVGTVEEKPTGVHVHDEVVNGSGVVQNTDTEVNYLSGVFKTGTGKVEVIITGGTVGDTTPGHEGRNNGRVYGAGRGVSAQRSDYVASMEYVNETFVTIGTSGQQPSAYTGSTAETLNYPYIYGAVFGGGENGHVKKDTDVKIYSGIIGWPLLQGTSQDAQRYKEAADGSVRNPYRGHVFGGGRGVDPAHHQTGQERSSTAGRVYGHTNVTMTGGLVRRAIYGGGLLASVGVYQLNSDDEYHIQNIIEDNESVIDAGSATITISGGYIGNVDSSGNALSGTDNDIAYLAPGDNNGFVFGSSCGMVADDYVEGDQQVNIQYRQMGYAHSTLINISGTPHIFGCVFGSGENGHVWEDARININGGTIGSEGNTSKFVGNVYGSGRGVDHPHTGISETAGKVLGNTTVNITGGTVWRDVYGGGSLASVGDGDETAADSKISTTNDPTTNNPFPYSSGLTRVVLGGTGVVHGSVYGSGRGVASTNTAYRQAAYVKNTLVTVQDSAHIYQNVFGGGNAGHVRRNTDVTIDGSAKVDGSVYGGGAGDISSPTAGLVNHDVEVNIRGGIIAGDVYGGGAIANTNVHDKRNDPSLYPAKASAYGEPEEDVFAKTDVNLLGGIILGDAYGGGQGVIPASTATEAEIANAGALVRGDVTVTLNGTAFYPTTTTDDQGNTIAASGRVFGCNNLNGTPQGTVLVHVKQTKGLTKSGDTYTVNANKPERGNDTYELEAVYGGGNLASYDPWDDTADGQFTSYTYSEGTVAHDATHKPLQVVIDSCDVISINYVYGGGNAAAAPSTDVVVIGAYEIGNVFGGGNGKDRINKSGNTWTDNPGADVGYLDGTTSSSYGTGNALANVLGGTVHYAFGGSNTLGNVRNNAKVFIDQASDCQLDISEVYGGGNEAYMEGNSEIELGCISALKDLYGGARNADVNGNITLTISSGTFERVFGGNNLGGRINGAITVNIEETGCHPIIIGEIYAGGNQAPYSIYGYTEKRDASNNIVTDANGKTVWEVKTSTDGTPYADPQVNAKSFTSIGTIYGGGFGESAVMAANPHVNVNVVEHSDTEAQTSGEYAGETKTIGGHQVTLPSHEKNKIGAIQTIFGGGNAAKVIGNTFVNVGTLDTVDYVSLFKGEATARTGLTVKGADIRGNVYGGGNAAEVTGNTNVQIGQ